ncbi:MAG: lysophospholipid acyltransferase family protein [Acidobacteriota bacterium]
MSARPMIKGFFVRGVFWRQVLSWGVRSVPFVLFPVTIACWSFLFFVFGKNERRGVVANVRRILPHCSLPGIYARSWVVFWHFSWTITDTARFRETKAPVDWEFDGISHFNELLKSEGAIILTAHMGNYDLGAYLFAERLKRPLVIIRAPEEDPETQRFESDNQEKVKLDGMQVDYNTASPTLALDLINALNEGKVVAIQGDRATRGINVMPATLFGVETMLPSGPFALSMATRVPIFPLFVIPVGWRRYRVVTLPPFHCQRTGRDREADMTRAMGHWTSVLQQVIRQYWFQWYMFHPMDEEPAR